MWYLRAAKKCKRLNIVSSKFFLPKTRFYCWRKTAQLNYFSMSKTFCKYANFSKCSLHFYLVRLPVHSRRWTKAHYGISRMIYSKENTVVNFTQFAVYEQFAYLYFLLWLEPVAGLFLVSSCVCEFHFQRSEVIYKEPGWALSQHGHFFYFCWELHAPVKVCSTTVIIYKNIKCHHFNSTFYTRS